MFLCYALPNSYLAADVNTKERFKNIYAHTKMFADG